MNSGFYKNIISYGNAVYVSLAPTTNDVIVSFGSSTTNTVVNNIPLQTWVHLAFSLNGQTLDTYLNGKLVKTNLIKVDSYKVPTSQSTITLGGSNITPADCASDTTTPGCGASYGVANVANPGFSGWITQFQYAPAGSDPQSIWNIYQQGNGTNMFSNFFGNYGLSVALTNNGVAQKYYFYLTNKIIMRGLYMNPNPNPNPRNIQEPGIMDNIKYGMGNVGESIQSTSADFTSKLDDLGESIQSVADTTKSTMGTGLDAIKSVLPSAPAPSNGISFSLSDYTTMSSDF